MQQRLILEPFSTKYQKKLTISVPSDLVDLLEQSKLVKRFVWEGYDNTPVFDNNYAHSIRMYKKTRQLGLSTKAQRQVLIHDLPEMFLVKSDMTALDKEQNPDRAMIVFRSEQNVAKSVLSPSDFKLWKDFESVKPYLEAEETDLENRPPDESFVTKAMDIVDGDMCLHFFLSKAAKTNPSVLANVPDGAFVFGFVRFKKALKTLSSLGLNPQCHEFILDLYAEDLAFVVHCWEEVTEEYIPKNLLQELLWAKSEVDFRGFLPRR